MEIKRGMDCTSSNKMTKRYLEEKAKEEGLRVDTIQADMTDFRLERKADFAFIMMGSLDVKSDAKFVSHLDSVAASVEKGGLYFIQNKLLDWTKIGKESWTMEKNGITVETTFECWFIDIVNQIYTEKMTLEVDDNGEGNSSRGRSEVHISTRIQNTH